MLSSYCAVLQGLQRTYAYGNKLPTRIYLLLGDQGTHISSFREQKSRSMHGKYFSLLQKFDLRCSTIARGYIRIPLPKAVKISAPNTSAIYLTSLNLSHEIDVSFTEKESYARTWLVGSAKIISLHLSIWSFLLNCGAIPRLRTTYLHLLQLRKSSRRPRTVLQDDVH